MPDPFRKARGRRRDTADSLEIERIVGLPLVYPVDDGVIEAFCSEEVQGRYFEEGFRLFGTQVGAVLAYDLYGGGFFPIGVGWGKTLITLMIANRAYLRGDSERSMLIVPPQVYGQLTRTDIPQARKWVGLAVPFHLLGGRSLDDRRRMASSGKRGCYILPYSLLSTRDSEALLGGDMEHPPPNKRGINGIRPDLLILDEAHNVKNAKAARTRRLRRYLSAHQPAVVALSGTITSKSINDYHHLISAALKELCPLPQSETLATNWSYVLDPEKPGADFGSRGGSHGKTGPITPLVDWARRYFPNEEIPSGVPGFRKAYRLRLTTTPGVVATGDAQIGVSLTMCNNPVPKHKQHQDWPLLYELMKQVEDEWITPSGDEIEEGMHKWRYLNELSSGFYYRLRWPDIEELTRRGTSEDEAVVYLEQAMAHHEARQKFARKLRRWIQYQGRPGLDTPLLVTANMAQHGKRDVGDELYALWRAMKDLEFDGMPERISEPVRICDYKVRHAVRWAEHLQSGKRPRGGIIWFHHKEIGLWVTELLHEAGVTVVYCPSESVKKGSNQTILDPSNADKIVVASMGGHGTGKNLQHYDEQFFLQFPRQADTLEQVLGRTHRNGQQADEMLPVTCHTTDFDHQNLWACLIDSLYIHQTTGSRQKAIYASYDPMPRRFPTDFLRERGFTDVAQLDREAKARLAEKFGESLDPSRPRE
jgi:hypothetical protein